MNEAEMTSARQRVAAWLTERVFSGTDAKLCELPGTAWERFDVLRGVLEDEPRLARVARHLSLLEQLRLSVEVVDAAQHAKAAGWRAVAPVVCRRCCAGVRRRRRLSE